MVKSSYPGCPVIMFTGTGNEQVAVDAMKDGFDDYVIKSPKHFMCLPAVVKASLEKAGQRQARKEAEEKLESSLKEKEILLRETHHRVKNNMQVIFSLLDMMIMRTQNQEALALLENARIKIYTMFLVHSQLYRNDSLDQVNMESHIRDIVNHLKSVNLDKDVSLTPVVDYPNVYLPLDRAMPCALVINELIFNSFKHAFKGRKKGNIEVSLKKLSDNTVLLRVQDDGIGMPEEIDIFNTNSLGLKLVKNIVCNQLMGKIRIERGIGTAFFIEFKY